ncbi:MAG: aminotransferase class V-fold PLP-dependent enzyme [Candidatus Krumholzibacteriia bacterium]
MEDLIYLDNAATAYPKPPRVIEAMASFYRDFGVNPGRSGYDLAVEAGLRVDRARRELDAFFNNPAGDYNRLVFASNASDALNLTIQGICRPGDHVIATTLEHNSVLRPLYVLEQQGVITHELVPCDGDGFVDPDEFARRIRPDTRLVVVNHGSNVLGTVQPVAEIGRICRDRGVVFAIDAAQTAGVVPIDMAAMNVDVVAFTGHKSLMGPTGIGGMAVGPDVPIRSTRWGGTGVRSAVRTHLDDYPFRCEVGTLNTVGIAGLLEGVLWVEEQTVAALHHREMELARLLQDGLQETPGVTTYCCGNDDRHLPVVCCNVDGMEAGEAGMILDVQHDIATRTGLHCAPLAHEAIGTMPKGTVRFSIGPFNTEDHVLAAVRAMASIVRMQQRRTPA